MGTELYDTLSVYESDISDSDPDWYLFVLDHKSVIYNAADIVTLSPDLMSRAKFNLRGYLRMSSTTARDRDVSLEWIVRMLNDIPTDVEFQEQITLRIPTLTYIYQLYQSYQTTKRSK